MSLSTNELRAAFKKLGAGSDHFQIAAKVGAGYVARTQAGNVAWVVPLPNPPETSGRRAGGFALAPTSEVAFEFEAQKWSAPAAVWESTDPAMLDTFLVLIGDAAARLGPSPTWSALVALVDDWQDLLARRSLMTPEQQLGLWAELAVIEASHKADELVAGWRGPDGDAIDFFVGEIGLEVKASRRRHRHKISQTQADSPVGVHEAFTLSYWVGQDPSSGRSLAELVASVLERIDEKPLFLKKLAKVGFSLADQESYRASRYVELEVPLLFETGSIPRIHEIPPAISELRYSVELNVDDSLVTEDALRVWHHFGIVPSEKPTQAVTP